MNAKRAKKIIVECAIVAATTLLAMTAVLWLIDAGQRDYNPKKHNYYEWIQTRR